MANHFGTHEKASASDSRTRNPVAGPAPASLGQIKNIWGLRNAQDSLSWASSLTFGRRALTHFLGSLPALDGRIHVCSRCLRSPGTDCIEDGAKLMQTAFVPSVFGDPP